MPFPFDLGTTSSALLSAFFSSSTHPSLLLTATTRRSVLKDALKKHKRLSPQARAGHLATVQDAIVAYLPYLLALNTATGYRDVGHERVDVDVIKPLEVEWRLTLSATIPGREAPRQKVTGLHHEIAFTLSTLAYVHTLLARVQLKSFRDSTTMTSDQQTSAVGTAMKHLLEAHSIHAYLLTLPSISAAATSAPPDVQFATISALSSLALADATLIVVAKDDPYAAAAADDRNANVTDWMFKAPSIPKVRAHLYARICLAAAEYASQANALLARNEAGKLDEDLVKYASDLRRTARGRAARFLGIDAELSGKTGEGLAWLRGARKELGFSAESEEGKRKGFRGLKQSWQERREDKKVEKGGEWGMDAGRLEEMRVLEMLEAKWDKENSTVNVQTVPSFEPLLANFPSGREYHTPQQYQPPNLDAATLAQLRAPPDPNAQSFRGEEDDSGGEESGSAFQPPGAFPDPADRQATATASRNYY